MSRRRIPLKVAPSPAAQRPENKSVEKLVESSRAHQERMRNAAGSHAVQKEKPKAPDKPLGQQKPAKPEGEVSQTKAERKPKSSVPAAPQVADIATSTTPKIRKMTLHVPINSMMDSRAGKVAGSIGKDADYVLAAYLKRSIAALRNRWNAGKLDDLRSDANLLLDQSADGGTRPIRKYLTIDVAMISDAQALFDDPLGLLSENKIMSAFLGAELAEQLEKA